ncbi:hypothetical protein HHI36_019255 [Cryptolaemus montrouzieri]|uniref:Uncharacterized protein n=1 Tax=Cryptolaemus montrouzieri TaxID=559131 RepID=A0ABD2P369_9CUCU
MNTLQEAAKQNCYDRQRTAFDPIDHIVEYLWFHNPKYPERMKDYKSIYDVAWIQNYLKNNPRPCYPFHLIWSDEFAALKIQSFMRGYWVRKRIEVQEVRNFWKQLKEESRGSRTSISQRFFMMD